MRRPHLVVRVRTSTLAVLAVFVAALVTYLLVQPPMARTSGVQSGATPVPTHVVHPKAPAEHPSRPRNTPTPTPTATTTTAALTPTTTPPTTPSTPASQPASTASTMPTTGSPTAGPTRTAANPTSPSP
jgi:hypothetical protein